MKSIEEPKSAQDVLINSVNNLPNLIKLSRAPEPDKVVRIVPLKSRTLDLLNGPDQAEWEQIKRVIFIRATLSERTIDPVPVGTLREWTLLSSDVPVITLSPEGLESLGLETPDNNKVKDDNSNDELSKLPGYVTPLKPEQDEFSKAEPTRNKLLMGTPTNQSTSTGMAVNKPTLTQDVVYKPKRGRPRKAV